MTGLLQGNTLNLGTNSPTPIDFSVGDIRSQITAEWLQIAQRSQWRAYRKLPSLFLKVPSLTPYDLPSPKMGFHMPPTYANGHISATGDLIHFMFGSRVGFSGTADRDRTALFTVRTNPRWRPPPCWIISNGHISASRGQLCDSTALLPIFKREYLENGSRYG